MMSRTIYTEVEVEVDLEDFNTEDLIEELESRGHSTRVIGNCEVMLEQIWQWRRLGKPYDHLMDAYLYAATERAI
jgi:hypothetical protein